jgi:hypothetical protein
MKGARVAAIIHEYDQMEHRRLFRRPEPNSLLGDIFAILETRGWTTCVIKGTSAIVEADAAVMHVNATYTPDDYIRFGQRFPYCVNGRVTDISKSTVSDASVSRSDDWKGPVIVKTELNFGGYPERRQNRLAARRLRKLPFPQAAKPRPYRTFRSLEEVPPATWTDPAVMVERFLPERLPDGFGMCIYIFCGEYEFCGRFVGTSKIVKGQNVFRHEIIPVPQHIRERRHELGFDYGKFDFVHHEEKTYLIDANKTPGRIPPSGGASLDGLADGFLGLLEKRL